MFNKFSGNGEPIFLFIFFGGHGVSHRSKQIGLLNSRDANGAIFNIENKLKTINNGAANTSRTFVFFDCCNTPLSGHSGLLDAVGGKGENAIPDPNDLPDPNKPAAFNKYIEFSTARRGEIAAKDAQNANKVYRWFVNLSKREPVGFLEMPGDISEIPGGNINTSGGQKYLLPFGDKPSG